MNYWTETMDQEQLDAACTQVREVVNAYGSKANMLLKAFRNVGKCEPKEGHIICGCRIDRIGSEDISEAFSID